VSEPDDVILGCPRSICSDYDRTFGYSWSNDQRPGCVVFVPLLVTTREARVRTFRERIRRCETEHQSASIIPLDVHLADNLSLHQNMFHAYERTVDPLLTSIRRELGAIIARLHRIDFDKSVDLMSGMGGGSSIYMKDLVEKLSFIRSEIFSKFNVGEAGREWVMSIVKFVTRTFVRHMSIAKPLGESGKLQLTSDMTELEFALSAFMLEDKQNKRGGNLESAGDDYRALRAMR